MVESSTIADMLRTIDAPNDPQTMTEKTLNLRGLKCPLPALRTRKALGAMAAGDILIVECTDPLAGIDIPNLLNQTGDTLEDTHKDKKLLTFRIRKV
jgi:tRNA 2-thiouridine synthesizing protein A